MKKVHLIIAVLFLALFTACGTGSPDGDDASSVPPEPVQTQAITPTPTPTPVPTPTPDFSDADLTGTWAVSGIISPDGTKLDDAKLEQFDTDFILELSSKNAYFVYDEEGNVKGQGSYSVSQNRLTLSAEGMETVYIIIDENTLHGMALDDSVTVMTRCPDETDDTDDDTETDVTEEDTPAG